MLQIDCYVASVPDCKRLHMLRKTVVSSVYEAHHKM